MQARLVLGVVYARAASAGTTDHDDKNVESFRFSLNALTMRPTIIPPGMPADLERGSHSAERRPQQRGEVVSALASITCVNEVLDEIHAEFESPPWLR